MSSIANQSVALYPSLIQLHEQSFASTLILA